MRTHGVVFRDPVFGFISDLVEVHEDPGIEHAAAVAPVEAFDEPVLHWLTGLCEFEVNVVRLTPVDEGSAGELGSVVYSQPLWKVIPPFVCGFRSRN